MGFLRCYLALCVVMAHTGIKLPWLFLDGRQAVQLFFLISGFYMQFVLATKYTSMRQFYAARLLRIYIPYFVVIGLVLVLSTASGVCGFGWLALSAYVNNTHANGWAGVIFAGVTNITVFLQDWVMFLQHDAGAPLRFTADFWNGASPLFHYLLIPQSWSIGVELSFYLAAPLIARRMGWVALPILILCSMMVRFATYAYLGGAKDPWTYRFFPFELAFFASGMLSARLYMAGSRALPTVAEWCRARSTGYAYPFVAVMVLALLMLDAQGTQLLKPYAQGFFAQGFFPFGREVPILAGSLAWAMLLPIMFALSRFSSADRFLGELSYPIYLVHYVIVEIAGNAVAHGMLAPPASAAFSMITSVLVSVALVILLIIPLERWREAKVRSLADTNKNLSLSGPAYGNA